MITLLWRLPLVLAARSAGPVLLEDLRRRLALDRQPRRRELLRELGSDEFRAVLYLRLRNAGTRGRLVQRALRVAWPGPAAWHIACDDVGPGFDVMHGFATIVHARRIGRDCTISQQVTIGTSRGGTPSLGDRVSVMPGAIIIGSVDIGDGVVVGAGAVVTRDVPDGVTVAGVPARVLGPSERA